MINKLLLLTLVFLISITTFSSAVIIEDFEDGVFLDGNPITWECPVIGDYGCYSEISSSVKKNGNYSLRLGEAGGNPTKFATPISFQFDTWYGAWMLESNNNLDHSMFELYVSSSKDAASVIRAWDKGSGLDEFMVYSTNGYLEMDGVCPKMVENTWYFNRLKKNSVDGTFDAEVYDGDSNLICFKYGYPPRVGGAPTHLRLLGDQEVPYTYWDDVVVGPEIPSDIIIEPPGCVDCDVGLQNNDYLVTVKISLVQDFPITSTSSVLAVQILTTIFNLLGFEVEILNILEV
ncbi:hypothetical protein LCGC14_2218970 [marine sediment metagenome]|uniref:Uncharacterized protein n=1 Tax=marine sediment metagenome TaxID=412755 RepID=A0A0F9FP42_9ZZZZ